MASTVITSIITGSRRELSHWVYRTSRSQYPMPYDSAVLGRGTVVLHHLEHQHDQGCHGIIIITTITIIIFAVSVG